MPRCRSWGWAGGGPGERCQRSMESGTCSGKFMVITSNHPKNYPVPVLNDHFPDKQLGYTPFSGTTWRLPRIPAKRCRSLPKLEKLRKGVEKLVQLEGTLIASEKFFFPIGCDECPYNMIYNDIHLQCIWYSVIVTNVIQCNVMQCKYIMHSYFVWCNLL